MRVSRAIPLALLLALTVAAPAHAASLDGSATPVFPGLDRHELSVRLADGKPAVANVLRMDVQQGGLEIQPVQARDRIGGLETVPSMGGRGLGDGLLAGVNGGFWLNNPIGDPNGYLASGGALISESQTQGAGPRGTFAVRAGGALLFDRLAMDVSLRTPTGATRPLTALNRGPSAADGAAPLYLYTRIFAPEVTVAPISQGAPVRALVVDGLRPPPGGSDDGVVAAVTTSTGPVTVPADGAVLVAHGPAADELAPIQPGEQVAVTIEPRPLQGDPAAWSDVVTGLAGGPLIVSGGQRTDPAGWESEGFAPQVHSLVRHPRTAVAQLQDGDLLLVTVDGRQPGYSHGMTIAELADFLIGLGVTDALSLDGGGSTQLAVEGVLRNRPCCDANLRPVANGLFVGHRYTFTHATRLAGANRNGTAAAIAAAAYPDGAGEVVLASSARFPDALAGGPLATAVGGPLLLTNPGELPDVTREALDELAPETVTVLGGIQAVSDAVLADLQARGYATRRIAGADRIETAAEIAEALGVSTQVFLASASDFPDALTAAAPAGMLAAPVLLTEHDSLPTATLLALRDAGEVVLAGGELAVSAQVEQDLRDLGLDVVRLAGGDRFGTARAVNLWAEQRLSCAPPPETATVTAAPCLDPAGMVVARGDVFADALAGGPLAAVRHQLLTIVPSGDVYSHPDAAAYLQQRDAALTQVTLLGGVAALNSYQHWQLDQLAR